ncbi:gamma-glutamylcyclotransferase [Terrisporobacter mayombei]|uniref:Gamma-glutamylcyclotransferase AIG2-like domain-containing protein n=1 Tax=Terrisporobacter mayombei TaxID=1541 RepID=A0ABY9Q6W2_9FIRM|nr:gamma-glutamylcyclotransferase [Terrisporobacter mayombei]MCC3868878.1 gamma-glutamylcyclotransferase [Terrisporobacter mayombei]WMT82989.1 hypothetical protein TEMA_34870 [Terrisporobacter mayombei]
MEGFLEAENPDNEYHKVILEVENIYTKEKEKCFVYFYNKDKDDLFDKEALYIESGNWKEYMLGQDL